MKLWKKVLLASSLIAASCGLNLLLIEAAQAQLTVCNKSSATAWIAVGFDAGGNKWTSEGWWQASPGECTAVVSEALESGDYYYLYASDKDEKWVWGGNRGEKNLFCVKPEVDFKLTLSDDNCSGVGTDKRNFWEVKVTGSSYTMDITD